MKAYWFSRDDGTTENQRVPVAVGRTDTFDGTPIPCKCGLHSSPTPFDALQYACGARLWEVGIPDDSVPHGCPTDKHAGKWRTPLRSVDLRAVMVEFSCRQAEGVLCLFEKQFPDDSRPRQAIETARRHIEGKATDFELSAAGSAAWSAAWSAADAAERAAWSAAESAAWSAARDMFNEMALAALEEVPCA